MEQSNPINVPPNNKHYELNNVSDDNNISDCEEYDEDYYIKQQQQFNQECDQLINDVKLYTSQDRDNAAKSLLDNREKLNRYLLNYENEMLSLQKEIYKLQVEITKINKKIHIVCEHDWEKTKENFQYGEYIHTCKKCKLSM